MNMDQQFSLRWNNYLNQITDSFGSLRNTEDLVDVTLSCEGKKLKAHKMLLSACSTYFRDIFKDNPCQHPVIVFRNVKYADLEAIVDFMYKGEVNVIQEQLESFLGTAEMLEVKGLADGSGKESNFGEEESSTISKSQLESAPEPTPPADRSSGGTRDAPEVCPPKMDRNTKPSYLVSPLMKKRKYSASSNHGKTTEIKQRTLESEVSNLPIVPKIEQQEYIEDLTFEDEEEVYLGRPTNTEPLQTLLRNSKPDSPMEFNTSNNSCQNQPDSNMIEMGQMLLGEPGPSIEGLGQEPMHGGNAENISRNSNTGVLPFTCKVCGAGYKYERNLNAHFKCHTGETSCHVCSKMLSCKAAYRRHLVVIHGIVPVGQP